MKTKVIKQDIGTVQIKWVYGGVGIQFKLCRKKDPLTRVVNGPTRSGPNPTRTRPEPGPNPSPTRKARPDLQLCR